MVNCEQCNKEMHKYNGSHYKYVQKFCSKKCFYESIYNPNIVQKFCIDCNKKVTINSKLGRCKRCASIHKGSMCRGENNTQWKGDNASYKQKHGWVNKILGKAYECNEEGCSKTSNFYEWGNISGLYLRDLNDYRMMCHSCNIKMDNRQRNKKGQFV